MCEVVVGLGEGDPENYGMKQSTRRVVRTDQTKSPELREGGVKPTE